MSIRRVTCPACNAVANVPATMTNIKCPACGAVWNVNSPAAAKTGAATAAASPPGRTDSGETDDDGGNDHNVFVFAGLAGTLVFLAIVGIALVLFMPAKQKPTEPASTEVATAESAEETAPSYREVDLPESTRQRIYRDYRRMAASSIEKKLMARKGSVARESFDSMMRKIVDREITHFALQYNISEEDVMQIVAEGDAKQWPGSPKKKTQQPAP